MQDLVSDGYSEGDVILSAAVVESLQVVKLRLLLLHAVPDSTQLDVNSKQARRPIGMKLGSLVSTWIELPIKN